jgi:hypothetical protein
MYIILKEEKQTKTVILFCRQKIERSSVTFALMPLFKFILLGSVTVKHPLTFTTRLVLFLFLTVIFPETDMVKIAKTETVYFPFLLLFLIDHLNEQYGACLD